VQSNDDFDKRPDPFFRPAWEDAPDETERPHSGHRTTPPAEAAALLTPLAFAQDALARLDARAEAAPTPLRDGLIARLAFREAAGYLAAEHAWVHPHDLALRDLLLTGGFDAAVRADIRSRRLHRRCEVSPSRVRVAHRRSWTLLTGGWTVLTDIQPPAT
jgi:hypothetical protein